MNEAIAIFDEAWKHTHNESPILIRSRLALTYADTGQMERAAEIFLAIEDQDEDSERPAVGLRASAWYHFHYGEFLRLREDWDRSSAELNTSLKLSVDLGDRLLEASVLNSLGVVEQSRGNFQAALSFIEASIQIKEGLGVRMELGNAYNNLGIIQLQLGQAQSALRWLEKAAEWKERHGDEFGLASAYTNLGSAYLLLGDLERASRYIDQSIQKKKTVGDFKRLPTSLAARGLILQAKGDLSAALDSWLECVECAIQVGARAALNQLRATVESVKPSCAVDASKLERIKTILKRV
jgi:tetratricopeptide (TPR) repeat protein